MTARARTFGALPFVEEARARYLAAWRPARPRTEGVPVAAARGRVLAADVVAGTDLPPFERSAVDGYAVRAADVVGAAETSPIRLRRAGEVRMGSAAPDAVGPGEAMRVPTGGMLPRGADAVVMQEHVREEAGAVLVLRPVPRGDNVIGQGIDVRAGDLVLRRGRRLRPADLGVLAGLGLDAVDVTVRPTVAVLSTGDEVVPPGRPLGPGQVYDMNAPALAGAIDAVGGRAEILGLVGDERRAVDQALAAAVAAADMVLVSGGSSVGERDVVAEAIAALGPPGVIVHGVAVRPGKPTVLALAGQVPVIGLPGNPVSALVIFELLGRPVLEALLGLDPATQPWRCVRARAAAPLRAPGGRDDYRRVRLEARDDGYWAVPLPAGSQVLTSLVQADGLVVVPAGAVLDPGAEVEVRLLE